VKSLKLEVYVGQDVAEIMGITKWEPPIPVAMAGEVANVSAAIINYNFERWESVPDMFANGEQVVAVEKAHGTFCAIKCVAYLNHPEMFGKTGCITVGSKGLSKQGLVFKNNEANSGNVYAQALRNLLDNDFENSMATALSLMDGADNDKKDVTVLGEVFGGPIQDLKYGMTKPVFRVFDVKIGDEWLDRDHAEIFCSRAGLEMLPVLYSGPFDITAIEKIRDGKTALGGDNIREGVVVTSAYNDYHPVHGRKICKFISVDYLLRKGKNATEFQ
jgi:RNA ligase (TIGR02306 family)